jgi:hypothetical protein
MRRCTCLKDGRIEAIATTLDQYTFVDNGAYVLPTRFDLAATEK